MDSWEPLFDKAMVAIDSLPPHLPRLEWTIGGGTVLMFKYRHRLSHDVDIFITDAQYLTALSPRLNDKVEDLTVHYREDSQHVKLIFDDLGEVDFVAAPRLVADSTQAATIHGRKVLLDKPEEIIAKKCFYRADGFTARDVFDMAVFLTKDPAVVKKNLGILTARTDDIQRRLAFYATNKSHWDREISRVRPLPGFSQYSQQALSKVQKFYASPEQWLKSQALTR
ncbi:MAG: nucleotidyl transferase AbiEii/AbiGii toxin family protein [Acidithiobacillus ferrooxidans]